MHRLTRDQIRMLVRIVIDDAGPSLNRVQFNDAMLLLFEGIAGFEQLPRRLTHIVHRGMPMPLVASVPWLSGNYEMNGVLRYPIDARTLLSLAHLVGQAEVGSSR
jgi:hypothetical protein